MVKRQTLTITIIALFLLPGLGIFTACASKPLKSQRIETLLPSNTENSPWRKKGPPAIFKKDRLFEYINGGAEIYFEYGFHQAVNQEYVHGDKSITVDIYEMSNSDAAFGIYSTQRDYKLPALKIGCDGTQFDNHLAFWQDRYVVVVMELIPGAVSKGVLNQFAQKISLQIGKTSDLPKLMGELPKNGMVPRSRILVKGILGLNSQYYLAQENVLELGHSNVEGAIATYRINSKNAQLLLIQYNSSEESQAKDARIQQIYAGKYEPDTANPSIYKDKKERFYSVKSVNNFLFVIYKSDSPALIKEILKHRIPAAK
ncbi:MAG: hypothetical protein GY850_36160 [bacterium]|nr:hypothetical protein [bacterium]